MCFTPSGILLSLGMLGTAWIVLRCVHAGLCFLRALIMKECWDLSEVFFVYWGDRVISVWVCLDARLHLLICVHWTIFGSIGGVYNLLLHNEALHSRHPILWNLEPLPSTLSLIASFFTFSLPSYWKVLGMMLSLLLYWLLLLLFCVRNFLHSPDWPGAYSIDQGDLNDLLPLPPMYWDYKYAPPR